MASDEANNTPPPPPPPASWPTKKKRGTKTLRIDPSDIEGAHAADTIVALSRDDPSFSIFNHASGQKLTEFFHPTPSGSSANSSSSAANPSPSAVNPASGEEQTKFSHPTPPGSSGDTSPSAANPSPTAIKKQAESSNAISEVKSYNCYICGRAFSSYQALGGHVKSHWK